MQEVEHQQTLEENYNFKWKPPNVVKKQEEQETDDQNVKDSSQSEETKL